MLSPIFPHLFAVRWCHCLLGQCCADFELGNEQDNTLFSAQVKAMEARAVEIGKPKYFYYMYVLSELPDPIYIIPGPFKCPFS